MAEYKALKPKTFFGRKEPSLLGLYDYGELGYNLGKNLEAEKTLQTFPKKKVFYAGFPLGQC